MTCFETMTSAELSIALQVHIYARDYQLDQLAVMVACLENYHPIVKGLCIVWELANVQVETLAKLAPKVQS